MFDFILRPIRRRFGRDKEFYAAIDDMFGFMPHNIELYKLALIHKSASVELEDGSHINNERLEFLGDAVLSTVVAQFLFKKFPTRQEGFMTEMRSKIVSRASLNKLSLKFGLENLINYARTNEQAKSKSMGGNAFEAFTGALFLDYGYKFTYKIMVNRVIKMHIDIEELEKSETNYKSKLLEWAQRQKRRVVFNQVAVKGNGHDRLYHIQVTIDDQEYGKAADHSIKGAEQLAAEKTWLMMNEQSSQ
jgi:ribonuclease-3